MKNEYLTSQLGNFVPACTLCNSSLSCALQFHEEFPYMSQVDVQKACIDLLCTNWQPPQFCIQWWQSGRGRAVVRAAWYNEGAYCNYSNDCNGPYPYSPPYDPYATVPPGSVAPTLPPPQIPNTVSGACCISGICSIVQGGICPGGTYQGAWSTCANAFCGACCSSTTCSDIAGTGRCSGQYQGDSTICNGQCGACSYNSTSCHYTLPTTCSVGTYLGRGSFCGSVPATTAPAVATGACCVTTDPTTTSCVINTAINCATLGGNYLGDNVDCSQFCGACSVQIGGTQGLTPADFTCTTTQLRFCPAPNYPRYFAQEVPCSGMVYQACTQTGQCQPSGQDARICFLGKWTGLPHINEDDCPGTMIASAGGKDCFSSTAQTNGDCWCSSNSTCQTVPAGRCIASGCFFNGVFNADGTCPYHTATCPPPPPTSGPATTSPHPPTGAPTSGPAPPGSSVGTCCVLGVAHLNFTSAQCTALAAQYFTKPPANWFAGAPLTGTQTCSACCGTSFAKRFQCVEGLYYGGSPFTCEANGYVRATVGTETSYCHFIPPGRHGGSGYKCTRCVNNPTATLTVQPIGTAYPPAFIVSPPSDCVQGSFYNVTGNYNAQVLHQGSGTYTCFNSTGNVNTKFCPGDFGVFITLGQENPTNDIWSASYPTGDQIIQQYISGAADSPIDEASALTFYGDNGIQGTWAIALYFSPQLSGGSPSYPGTVTISAIDNNGFSGSTSLVFTGQPFVQPQGVLIWTNGELPIQQVDINTGLGNLDVLYIGNVNVRRDDPG